MKLGELALLMGKTRQQLIDELKSSDVIELKLVERNNGAARDNFKMEILN